MDFGYPSFRPFYTDVYLLLLNWILCSRGPRDTKQPQRGHRPGRGGAINYGMSTACMEGEERPRVN